MLAFFPLFSFAASEAFPVKEIFFQIFNFSIFATAFVFLIRKPIKIFFHKRQEEFFSFEKQAIQLEKEKKSELKTWEKKLETLREQEAEIQKRAKKEGEKFVFQKKEELKNLRGRLKKESDFFLHLEKEKSKRELIKKWKNKVVQEAARELEKQAHSASFQKKRLEDFFKQMVPHL